MTWRDSGLHFRLYVIVFFVLSSAFKFLLTFETNTQQIAKIMFLGLMLVRQKKSFIGIVLFSRKLSCDLYL